MLAAQKVDMAEFCANYLFVVHNSNTMEYLHQLADEELLRSNSSGCCTHLIYVIQSPRQLSVAIIMQLNIAKVNCTSLGKIKGEVQFTHMRSHGLESYEHHPVIHSDRYRPEIL